jgi:hypothetical protein
VLAFCWLNKSALSGDVLLGNSSDWVLGDNWLLANDWLLRNNRLVFGSTRSGETGIGILLGVEGGELGLSLNTVLVVLPVS